MARRLDEPSNTRLQRRGPSRTYTGFPVRRSSNRNDRPPTTRLAFRIAERFLMSSRGSGISVGHVCRPSGRTTTQQTARPAHGGPDDRPDDTGVGLVAASDLPGQHMTAANPQDSSDSDPSTTESSGRRRPRTPGPSRPVQETAIRRTWQPIHRRLKSAGSGQRPIRPTRHGGRDFDLADGAAVDMLLLLGPLEGRLDGADQVSPVVLADGPVGA